jgi:Rrf2 family protein
MAMLKAAGIVRSVRGSKGGYILAKSPGQVKVSECFQCLEGSIITTECVEDESFCKRTNDCIARQVWTEVQMAVMGVLQSITLQNLVDRAKKKKAINYHI